MEQTINAILNKLAQEHGNDWPEHALEMYLNLEITNRYGFGPVDYDQLQAMRGWVLDCLMAGIAFRQGA
jgi:hypothetical protein